MNGVELLAWGAGHLSLFEYRYSAAGAGISSEQLRKARFSPRWIQQDLQ